MKQIIDNKLYNTEKSKLIYSYIKNIPEFIYFLGDKYTFDCWRHVDLYKTSKGNYFIHVKQSDKKKSSAIICSTKKEEYIKPISYDEAKKVVQKLDIDKAIELFGEIEEA